MCLEPGIGPAIPRAVASGRHGLTRFVRTLTHVKDDALGDPASEDAQALDPADGPGGGRGDGACPRLRAWRETSSDDLRPVRA
jgi:hypothetical protein